MRHSQIVNQLKPILSRMDGISAAILYGSVARREATVNSDIDIALIVDDRFDKESLRAMLISEAEAEYALVVEARSKVICYFDNMRLKVEFSIHGHLGAFARDFTGSQILSELVEDAILLDRMGDLPKLLRELDDSGYTPLTVEDLVQKFIYEFDNASTYHRRSDGYRAMFFYQIALHCLVQLINNIVAGGQYQFLPRNVLVNVDESVKKRLYELSPSMYLPDFNRKKRALLELLHETLIDLDYPKTEETLRALRHIYDRDYYWNLRPVNTYNPVIGWKNLIRTSEPPRMSPDDLEKFLQHYRISTIIDLRAPREIEERPYSEDVRNALNYVQAPFDPWNQPDWFKVPTYQRGTRHQVAYRFFALGCRDSIRKAMLALREVPVGYGAAIHCVAGKDRTGFVCSLLHLLSGNSQIVMTDYLASEADSHPKKLQDLLDIIESEGGVHGYLFNCGLNEEEIQSIKKRLSHE